MAFLWKLESFEKMKSVFMVTFQISMSVTLYVNLEERSLVMRLVANPGKLSQKRYSHTTYNVPTTLTYSATCSSWLLEKVLLDPAQSASKIKPFGDSWPYSPTLEHEDNESCSIETVTFFYILADLYIPSSHTMCTSFSGMFPQTMIFHFTCS